MTIEGEQLLADRMTRLEERFGARTEILDARWAALEKRWASLEQTLERLDAKAGIGQRLWWLILGASVSSAGVGASAMYGAIRLIGG